MAVDSELQSLIEQRQNTLNFIAANANNPQLAQNVANAKSFLEATNQSIQQKESALAQQVTLKTESPATTSPSGQSVAALSSGRPSAVVMAAQNLGYTGNPNDTVAAQNFINANLPMVGTLTPTTTPINPIRPTNTVAPSNGNFTGTINSTGGVDPYPSIFTETVLRNAAALGYTGSDPVAAQQFLNAQYDAANPPASSSAGTVDVSGDWNNNPANKGTNTPVINTNNVLAAAEWLQSNPNGTVVLNGKIVDAATVMAEASKNALPITGNIGNTTGTGTVAGTQTGTAADTGTVVDTKPTTSIGALGTAPTTALSTSSIGALGTQSTGALGTAPTTALSTSSIGALGTQSTGALGTQPASGNQTGSIPSLTADQLKTYTDALTANQTVLSTQNADFLKNWQTSADTLKTDILSGVEAKNKQFGTEATQGFMDAFKNFQIPTNQQTGVNLGNYNDNRNAAADQWWSQYVTGRR